MSEQPDRMDLHEFRASRRRKTDNLLKEDHRDLKRFFALDSAAYRDASKDGGLDEKTKELLGLVASTVLRCNDCIAYHCDRCVEVGWKKAELLDALNVALVVGGSITIPHIRTVWEVVEQLYEEQEETRRAKEGTPALVAAASEVQAKVEEQDEKPKLDLGLDDAAKKGRRRGAAPSAGWQSGPVPQQPPAPAPPVTPATVAAAATSVGPAGAASPPATAATPSSAQSKPGSAKPKAPTLKPDAKPTKKSQEI